MSKKSFLKSVILIIVLCFCFTSIGIYAAENVNIPVKLEGGTLYANGNDITLKKDTDGKIYIYNNNGIKLVENSVSISTIYGGSKNKSITGDVNITVNGVNVSNIYGGGYSDGTSNADVNGNVSINIIGNANAGSVYGGGYARSDKGNAQANINGSVSINIPAKPTSNHGNIYGGGTAFTNSAYNATANVNGNINVYIISRTYSVRGGGNASTNAVTNGLAQANVNGNISIKADAVDVREIYGGGYASKNAQANSINVSVSIYNSSEIMILEGGGHSSDGAIANTNNISLSLIDCINIYGYIRGGGYAYNGGKSNTNNVSLIIKDSLIPASEQFGDIVSASVYGGGDASGKLSSATTNSVSIDVQGCQTAGAFYSGGESSKESNIPGYANAKVNVAKANYTNNKGIAYDGQIYESTVIAQGSSDDENMASVTHSEINVIDCDFDGIWGSGETKGNPFAMSGQSSLVITKEIHTKTVAGFDTISVKAPLYTEKLMGKSDIKPTIINVDNNVLVGTPLVYCKDIVDMKNVFTIEDNKLDYAVKDNQSIWSLGQMTYTITTKSNTGGTIVKSQIVNKFSSSTVTWVVDKEYQVDKIIVDGKTISITGLSYTFDNVSKNHTFEIQFKKIPGIVNEEVKVETKPGGDIPKVSIDLNSDKVTSLLSEEDKNMIADGKSIGFNLAVEPVKDIPAIAQQEIEKVIDKENILMTFDISLFKSIDGNKSSISQANSKIEIIIDIPKEYTMSNQDLAILRTHQNSDGSFISEVLKDIDDNVDTVTFETDKFSIYSLIYDVKKGEIVERPEINQKPDIDVDIDKIHVIDNEKVPEQNIVETNDILNVNVYILIMILSIIGLYISTRNRKDEISQ